LTVNPKQNISQDDRKRDEHLSTDGRWRSFPRVPHLLQYVSNGNYYGRKKLNGKVIRESLETAVWTTAKLKLVIETGIKAHKEKCGERLENPAAELSSAAGEHFVADVAKRAIARRSRPGCGRRRDVQIAAFGLGLSRPALR
jgi:hypothetical protein